MFKDLFVYVLTTVKIIQPIFVSLGVSEIIARVLASMIVAAMLFLISLIIKKKGVEVIYRITYCIGRMPLALIWAWKESKGAYKELRFNSDKTNISQKYLH